MRPARGLLAACLSSIAGAELWSRTRATPAEKRIALAGDELVTR
jgi:hypothetical protein